MHVEHAAQLVEHQRGQGLAVDVLGDDQQLALADLDQLLQDRDDVGGGRDLLVVDQDVRLLDLGFHVLGIGDEVGRDVAAVELHAFDVLGLELQALGFLDGDDAVLADLVHHLGDQVADLLVLGRDGGDGGDLFLGLDGDGLLGDGLGDGLGGGFDAALEHHRVGAGGQVLQAVGDHGVGQHGGGGRAVAGDVIGLGGGFLEELGAHVLERVFQLDFLGHGHAVVGDGGRTELPVQGHVAALGAEGRGHGGGQDVDPGLQAPAGVLGECELLCSHCSVTPLSL